LKPTIGFALSGSFCTFEKAICAMQELTHSYEIVPILSQTSFQTDTRFGSSEDFIRRIEDICSHQCLHTLQDVEPFGPKKMLELLIVAPCTGNTIGKLANGIADSPVSFAVKAHLRNAKPVVLALSTNDGLSGSAENIGRLLNRRHYYFVPFSQDDPTGKPFSLVAHFELLPQTVSFAMMKQQLQPILA